MVALNASPAIPKMARCIAGQFFVICNGFKVTPTGSFLSGG